MKCGTTSCALCSARFTFDDYELVDFREPDGHPTCEGCNRLLVILNASAKRKAEMKQQAEPVEQVDLTPSAILARLLANRRQPADSEPFDARMAAAGDRE